MLVRTESSVNNYDGLLRLNGPRERKTLSTQRSITISFMLLPIETVTSILDCITILGTFFSPLEISMFFKIRVFKEHKSAKLIFSPNRTTPPNITTCRSIWLSLFSEKYGSYYSQEQEGSRSKQITTVHLNVYW